ncbi:MAG: tRNA preQ1(34) S-adenosylmethionine ribosyltransferase-isomerase QueA [Aquificaceae bacterium]|nr:MAG: tRNA preQ1(34) S-adenosylmethionine ribosyltransferase-isomerase QueA [Aquificaceae bacterium]
MKLSDFSYDLPVHLIAQEALQDRTASRLLVVENKANDTASCEDKVFSDLLDMIAPHDLLVFNNTRVIPARLHGKKLTGGKVEVLVERLLSDKTLLAHVKASKSPKKGSVLTLEGEIRIEVLGRQGALFELSVLNDAPILELLEQYGHIPLPPYIERDDTEDDRERYQTVFAKTPGAVAAPTAGLHFTDELLEQLKKKGVETAQVTLHVGAGTFQPVRVNDLSDHIMHAEWVEVDESVCEAVKACKQRGGKVIAVGTTSVRSLESAAKGGELTPFRGDTRLFITPGCRFNVVDRMVTNFHLSESTLLMLVSAFSGYETIKQAYQHAITAEYRFFSYGDAMLLSRREGVQEVSL